MISRLLCRRIAWLLALLPAQFGCDRQLYETLFPPPAMEPAIIDPAGFPKDFLWGAGSSSHQVDGNDIHSDWWQIEAAGKTKTGQLSGLATDHWNRYPEDLDNLLAVNFDTYRFSLNWARLFPEAGMTEPDADAVQHYDDMFEAMFQRNIRPMVTLHHFTMPQWLTAQGRWETGEAVEDFLLLVRFAAARWGRYVDWWVTVNEPEVYAMQGWFNGIFPAGKRDFPLAMQVLKNLAKAHGKAYRAIKELDTVDADGDGKASQIGVAMLFVPAAPYNPFDPVEQIIAGILGAANNGTWLATNQTGRFEVNIPFIPSIVEELPDNLNSLDFIGVNYYSRALLQYIPPFTIQTGMAKDERSSQLGFELYPQGLTDTLEYLTQFGIPLVITENGVADAGDTLREEYVRAHLGVVSQFNLSHPQTPVLGYVYWSLTDNFEWENGFTPRFGLYAVNYDTQERTVRQSAVRLGELIASIKSGS